LVFSRKLALASTVLLVVFFSAQRGWAFCRTNACELDASKRDANQNTTCAVGPDGCVNEGPHTFWASPCLGFAVQVDGSPLLGLDADSVRDLVLDGFALWQNVDCPGGGKPGFEVHFQGFVACDRQEALCGGALANVSTVIFHDEVWPYAGAELGITQPAGRVASGEIYDADIEIQSQACGLAGEFDEDGFTVLAHELGHFLGLGHSFEPDALMSPSHRCGVNGTRLDSDDVAGICAIFPPVDVPLECGETDAAHDTCQVGPEPDAEPRVCRPDVKRAKRGGCHVAPESGLDFGFWAFGVAWLGAGIRRRSRRASG
jgi:hypothetical protein